MPAAEEQLVCVWPPKSHRLKGMTAEEKLADRRKYMRQYLQQRRAMDDEFAQRLRDHSNKYAAARRVRQLQAAARGEDAERNTTIEVHMPDGTMVSITPPRP